MASKVQGEKNAQALEENEQNLSYEYKCYKRHDNGGAHIIEVSEVGAEIYR